MIAFNSIDFFLQNQSGILIDKFITVQAAAEVSGYNAQYLRRLLRAGKLDGIRIGQVWLIKLESLAAQLEWAGQIEDRRCGPRKCTQPCCIQLKTRPVYKRIQGSERRIKI
jgi:excisionase family DNA binding protein